MSNDDDSSVVPFDTRETPYVLPDVSARTSSLQS
jgi:hypothetical protein